MKQIHTHRGHCQLCASVQAIDTQNGAIAEHGYTREHGYFQGSCPGSHAENLHMSRALADKYIKAARDEAADKRDIARRYEAKTSHPSKVWGGEYKMVFDRMSRTRNTGWPNHFPMSPLTQEEIIVKWAEATPKYQEQGRRRAIDALRGRAAQCEDYAGNLQTWADKITGKVDPYRVQDLEPRDHQVGDVVNIGGKKGFNAAIEAIETRPYTTFGCHRGRSTVNCKHARLTRPEVPEKRVSEKAGGYVAREYRPAKVVWVALRDIKRPPNPLAEELKKAGLL